MATKEVSFINIDSNTNLFYADTAAATVIDGTETTLETGVYIVEGSFEIENLTINGDVKLILADGCSYTTGGVQVNGSLTVYGQKEGTGALSSYADGDIIKAGIQVSDEDTVTIVGGKIIAQGSEGGAGAGIGSADGADVSGITIFGGDVNATGGSKAAGIGSGGDGKASYITIASGHVVATGIGGGAGIGGGNGGSSSEIVINGGDVAATGTGGAAGIGAGSEATEPSSSFTFNNGYVAAMGGSDGGAGIGGGSTTEDGTDEQSFVSQIYINGGSVSAVRGNDQAWAIGKGQADGNYPVSDIYVGGEMELKGDGTIITHTGGGPRPAGRARETGDGQGGCAAGDGTPSLP